MSTMAAAEVPRPAVALLAALCVVAATLAGCDRPASDPSMPPLDPARIEAVPITSGTSGTSVPAADTVPAPDVTSQPDPKAGRSNAGLSTAQESGAMPLPGQNNDHSAPLPAPKGASSP